MRDRAILSGGYSSDFGMPEVDGPFDPSKLTNGPGRSADPTIDDIECARRIVVDLGVSPISDQGERWTRKIAERIRERIDTDKTTQETLRVIGEAIDRVIYGNATLPTKAELWRLIGETAKREVLRHFGGGAER